ncbi:hypothetical protein [Novosphingobium sp.]|uniref:hypothetical protein n=1 Tax=Novosphingobium sp. TaxID=1874826 RepID=UPI00333FD2F7
MTDRGAGYAAVPPAAVVPSGSFGPAYAAMVAGCRFLIARGQGPHGVPAIRAPHRGVAMRRAGNCLRELDRMLSVLVDAGVADGAGGWLDSGTRKTPGVYAREGDAAHTIFRITALRTHFAADMPRLRAIGRIRAMATGDMAVEAASRPAVDLAAATMGRARCGHASPTALVIGDAALATIAEFYWVLADRLHRLQARAVIAD